MNHIIKHAVVAASAVGLTVAVQAQVEIRITGSTAFRGTTYAAIRNLYGANLGGQNPAHDASGKNQVTFAGTIPALFGTQTVTVRTSYSGSVEGIQSLVLGNNETFLASSNAGDTTTVAGPADIAFSDVFQSTTDFVSPVLSDAKVGIVCFAWVRSVVTPPAVNNMTHQLAQQFLATGDLPIGQFTGDLSQTQDIYLVGRNKLSGTRITTQADCGYGGNADAQLWQLDGTGGTVGTTFVQSTGFTSGGNAAAVLKVATATNPSLSYLGIGDANGVNGGANLLTFNGVPFSVSNVWNGNYSFWAYEHAFLKPSVGANPKKFVNDPAGLKAAIDAILQTSTANTALSKMKVARNADGGPIFPQ